MTARRLPHPGRLLAIRARLGLSQAKMAAHLLTPLSTYRRWETGARRTPGAALAAAELFLRLHKPRTDWNKEIPAAKEAGESLTELSRRVGVAKKATILALRVRGITLVAGERGRPPRRLSAEWDMAIHEAIAAGESITQLSRRVGVSLATTSRALKARGIVLSAWATTRERNASIFAAAQSGRTHTSLAAEYGVTRQRVSQIVARARRTAH